MQTTPKIIVLDDDPTGSQTVHSCLLLTRWDPATLSEALHDDAPLFFVLTNTRSMSAEQAGERTREVCRGLRQALAQYERPWLVVSRSDSTLRGHYPVETDVLSQELGPFAAHFMTPAFFEGGRITRGGIHYVVGNGTEVRADQTEFARDSVFGYSTSYLPDYVQEKTAGRIQSDEVCLFPATMSDTEMRQQLAQLEANRCCAVDAENQSQMDRFARLVLDAAASGKRFLFRSGASLLTSLAGLPPQPVPAERMAHYVRDRRPGLILVGSHVPSATRQLDELLRSRPVEGIELNVGALPDRDGAISRALHERLQQGHAAGRDVAIYTSRQERRFDSTRDRLAFGREVSRVLISAVAQAPSTLGFILSKGGITSNDVLSEALALRTARVVGQIHPGCSVVVTPREHRLASVPVVIFPGNVGSDESLRLVYDRLTSNRSA